MQNWTAAAYVFLLAVLSSWAAPVVHPVVKELGVPRMWLETRGTMAISTSSEKAAAHVKQGLALFSVPWDFEAYRHFCAATEEDPDCLMAHWGVVMTLAGGNSEFLKERNAAGERLLTLLERKNVPGTEMEQRYALAAIQLLTDGSSTAGVSFLKIAQDYPNDVFSRLLGHFLMRNGYDENGEPRVDQVKASEALDQLRKEAPQNASVQTWWISSLLEAPPSPAGLRTLREEALPVLLRLVAEKPDFPPYQLLLTHLQHQTGSFQAAVEAAEQAASLYEAYMQADGVTFYDCDGWVRTKLYQGHLLGLLGRYGPAVKIFEDMARKEIQKERVLSRGASLVLWQGRTLGARVYAAGHNETQMKSGMRYLEKVPSEQWFPGLSLVGTYRDGLVLYLSARRAILAKDMKAYPVLEGKLQERLEAMAGQRALAARSSAYPEWLHANQILTTFFHELRGLAAQEKEGALQLAARNWFEAAVETQGHQANLLPPGIAYAMERRLALFELYQGEKEDALSAANDGLMKRPNEPGLLRAKFQALERLGQEKEAAEVRKRLAAVLE